MYQPPAGFCFDILCNDEPIMDDRRLHDYNVDQKVTPVVVAVLEMMTTGENGVKFGCRISGRLGAMNEILLIIYEIRMKKEAILHRVVLPVIFGLFGYLLSGWFAHLILTLGGVQLPVPVLQ